MLGPSRIIGLSLDSAVDIASAPLDILDYVAIGAVFPTSTKGDAAIAGIAELAAVKAASTIPVVAIGGIDAENAVEVLGAGADGLAVISAILAGDVLKNCFTFQAIIDRKRDETAGA
jgi:thiamine-phosphate diphosphorylase